MDAGHRAQQGGAPLGRQSGLFRQRERFVDDLERFVEAPHLDQVIRDPLERGDQRLGLTQIAEGGDRLAAVAEAEFGVAELGGGA